MSGAERGDHRGSGLSLPPLIQEPQRRNGNAHVQGGISHLSDPPPTSVSPIFRDSLGQSLLRLF